MGASFRRNWTDQPGVPRVGVAPLTCRRTGDTFSIYWPATDWTRGCYPCRDPHPRIAGGRRAALLAAGAHCYGALVYRNRHAPTAGPSAAERWKAALDQFIAGGGGAPGVVAPRAPPRPPDGAKLVVWTDVQWAKDEVADPRIEFCDDLSKADAVFAHSGGGALAGKVSQTQLVSWYFCRVDIPRTSRGGAAAATWTFRGDESRLRCVRSVETSRGGAAAATWTFR